jgi:DNA-binding ferritin-like protein (Dps family)
MSHDKEKVIHITQSFHHNHSIKTYLFKAALNSLGNLTLEEVRELQLILEDAVFYDRLVQDLVDRDPLGLVLCVVNEKKKEKKRKRKKKRKNINMYICDQIYVLPFPTYDLSPYLRTV